MPQNVLQVLTFKSVETILTTGGTQSWAVDRNRARACKYVVCCRNANTRDAEGNEAHGSAFLIGLVSDVVPSTENDDRWLIRFSEYALVDVAKMWEGRNPVRFFTVDDYDKSDIDFDALDWVPMPEPSSKLHPSPKLLTIGDAKLALAEAFGVAPSAVEITIRG